MRRRFFECCVSVAFCGFCGVGVLGIGAHLAIVLGVSGRAEAKELRDPFTFGPGAQPPAPKPQGPSAAPEPAAPAPSPASSVPRSGPTQPPPPLIGVLWDATQPLAIVGEQTVGVGDVVGEWQVVEIRPDGIVVQRGERRAFVGPGAKLPGE